jgi:hypothetical protein
VQNGYLLTREFHALLDLGFVAAAPDHRAHISPALEERWSNGKRCEAHEGTHLRLPVDPAARQSPEALERRRTKGFVG